MQYFRPCLHLIEMKIPFPGDLVGQKLSCFSLGVSPFTTGCHDDLTWLRVNQLCDSRKPEHNPKAAG